MAKIAVTQIEYNPNGKAVWIHNAKGVTVLRLQCTGNIKELRHESFTSPTVDVLVTGDIVICKPPKRKKK